MLFNQINGQPYSAIAASFNTWIQWSCLIFTGELNDEKFHLGFNVNTGTFRIT